jgi:trimeric autotransporter adhesin
MAGAGVMLAVVVGLVLADTVSGGSSSSSASVTTGAKTSSSSTSHTSTTHSSSAGGHTTTQSGGSSAQVTIRPKPLHFAGVPVGTDPTLPVNVFDHGPGSLTVTVTPSLGGSADFTIASDTCANGSVAAAGSCAVTIRFAPKTAESVTGTLLITDDGTPHTTSVQLFGSSEATTTTTITSTPSTTSTTSTQSSTAGSGGGNTATTASLQ